MGSEFKAIILSPWKIPCTLPGNCALCIFIFVFFVPFISMQVVHMFNTFQWFVSIGYEGCWCKWTHIHASVTCFSADGVSSFDILLYFVIAAKKKYHNLWTCICTYMLVFSFRLSRRGFFLKAFCVANPFWHLSTRYKAQSLLPFNGISSYSYY